MYVCFSAGSTRGASVDEWSPTSVFDETDGGTMTYPAADVVNKQVFGMKHIDISARAQIVEVLVDRGELRRAGIGLVGRLFRRKYRKSHASKMAEEMAAIDMHR